MVKLLISFCIFLLGLGMFVIGVSPSGGMFRLIPAMFGLGLLSIGAGLSVYFYRKIHEHGTRTIHYSAKAKMVKEDEHGKE